LLARVSGDAMGRRLRRHLESNGLTLDHVVLCDQPTSLAIVSVSDDGVADYDFRVDGTADWQWTDDELSHAVDDTVAALHVGSLAMALEPGAGALRRLVERVRSTVTITYDPNVRPSLMGPRHETVARIETMVRQSDVVKASAEDVAWLYPQQSPASVAQHWLELGPACVVVTLGPDGVVAAGAEAGLVQRQAAAVSVVDTVGAGDAFMAALIAGLASRALLGRAGRDQLSGADRATMEALLDQAALAAALTCARAGADPPTADELRRAEQT
jgi:fructokinase